MDQPEVIESVAEEVYTEDQIRKYLEDEGCSFLETEALNVPEREGLDLEAVFNFDQFASPGSEVTPEKIFSNVYGYLLMVPITDTCEDYNQRHDWKTEMYQTGGIVRQAYYYIRNNNAIRGNNITKALLSMETLAPSVKEEFAGLAEEMLNIVGNYSVKAEEYKNMTLDEKLDLAKRFRRDVFSLVSKFPRKNI